MIVNPGTGFKQCDIITEYRQKYYERPARDNNLESEFKAKWIADLLSGKYLQGPGGLERGNRNCCLGVLARTCGLEVTDPNRVTMTFIFPWVADHPYEPNNGYLGHWWAQDKGFVDHKGSFWIDFCVEEEVFYQQFNLAQLNDDGFSFAMIADVIEYFF